MRVLYFSPRDCWPITSGARLRDYHLARELSCRTEFTYLGFRRDGETAIWRGPVHGLENAECVLVPLQRKYSARKLLRGFLGPEPVLVLNYAMAAMRDVLTSILDAGHFDLVQVEGIHLSSYVPLIRGTSNKPRVIGDWHNIESELMRRYSENPSVGFAKRQYAARTAHLLEDAEKRFLETCDSHLVCSERERQALLSRMPSAQIRVVPNGVDVSAWKTGEPQRKHSVRRDVLFVGSMDYHANIDAAIYFTKEIWPALSQLRPDLRFVIAGSRPAREVEALRRIPGVTVTGTVDSIAPYYQEALVSVVPLRVGGGTRLKVLEAMAAGVPVVSTSLGAEGLAVSNGRELRIADEPESFARAVAELCNSETEWHRFVCAGREAVTRHYDWAAIGGSLCEYYLGLTRDKNGSPVK